jgi:hypothetical protein
LNAVLGRTLAAATLPFTGRGLGLWFVLGLVSLLLGAGVRRGSASIS